MKYFNALIKPASSLCNMRCRYCFYADEAAARQISSHGVMTREVAHKLIDRIYESDSPLQVNFMFQGGEPTLAGLDFFRDFCAYAKENAPDIAPTFAMQTNALVIDEKWAEFLASERFLVGVSLDLSREFHDRNRRDAAGKDTFSRVLAAARLMEKKGADVNILAVVTKQMARHSAAAYAACRKLGFTHYQLIACLDPLENDGPALPYTLTARDYGAFLNGFFEAWYKGCLEGHVLSVRQFDNYLMMAQGRPCEQCGLMGRCTPQFVVEADGSVYPCDFYALDKYHLGNIMENTVDEIAKSPAMARFAMDQNENRSEKCLSCPARGMCGGGCRRYRPLYFADGDYCPMEDFFTKQHKKIIQLASLVR